MVALKLTDEDMLPEIAPGNLSFLDTSQRQPIRGGIYVIGIDRTLFLRRLAIHHGKPMFITARYDPAEPLPLDAAVVVDKVLSSSRGGK